MTFDSAMDELAAAEAATLVDLESYLATVSAGAADAAAEAAGIERALQSTLGGRLGERLAVQSLACMFQGSMREIKWVNEAAEQFLPYDVTIELTDGSKKYCEVKSRVVTERAPGPRRQWLVSPQEVASAVQQGRGYFACCIAVRVRYSQGRVRVAGAEGVTVGRDAGLVNAIRQQQAQLVLQI